MQPSEENPLEGEPVEGAPLGAGSPDPGPLEGAPLGSGPLESGPVEADALESEPLTAPLESDSLTEDRYRLLSSYAASGVAVVSTRVGGRDYGATVTAWFSVSYDPPTMLVSLFELSRIAEAVEESGTWALSLLNREQEQTAKWLSSPGAPVEGLFNQVPHHRGPLTDAPILDGAIAWFELRTVDVQRAATHQLFVGRVLSQGRDAATPSRDPLIHFASMYRRLER